MPFLPQRDDPSGAAELARHLRRLRGHVAASRFTDLRAEIELARELADRIEAAATPYPPAEYPSWGVPEHIASNPAVGIRNPISPPLEAELHPDGSVSADIILGIEYQGPPGCVHGGIIALLFDEMLGLANAAGKTVGMTADLRLTYKAPTPLDTPLRFTARQDRTEGRKIFSSATLHAGETLTASAEGLFVTPKWMVGGDHSHPVEG